MQNLPITCAVVTMVISLGGCATSGPSHAVRKAPAECGHTTFPIATSERNPSDQKLAPTDVQISLRSLEAARIIGVEGLLTELLSRSQLKLGDSLELMRLRQRVMDRITLANLEIASVLAEIGCEGERTDQVRDQLQTMENRRLQQFTIASIFVGAGTVVGSGALALAGNSTAGNVVSVVGGLTETGLAWSTLESNQSGTLSHQRNLLAEVWYGPGETSPLPPIIWRFLHAPSRTDPGRTNREVLLDEWRNSIQADQSDAPIKNQRHGLLFSPGGRYSLAELKMRESMLDLLEARIALFNRELVQLLREILAID